MVPVLVGFAQGDRPAPLQFVGMAFAIIGIVLAARASDPTDIEGHPEPPSRRRIGPGVVYALVAVVFVGLLVTSWMPPARGARPGRRSCSASSPCRCSWWRRSRAAPERVPTGKETGTLVVVGAFDNLANVTFALAAQSGMLALVSVVGSLYPVSTVLLARGFLHERLSRPQLAGVITAFAGVVLIALG